MTTEEALIFVDQRGAVTRVAAGKRLPDEYTAVVLVLVYLPREKQVLLFNRGSGASDMQDHWALTAGKMNSTDCAESLTDVIGKPLSLKTQRESAAREFMEELNITAETDRFQKVVDFHMPEKGLYFCMMAWPISENQLEHFSPDGAEVQGMRRFSLDDFISNGNLGDAIRYKKSEIVSFLRRHFAA